MGVRKIFPFALCTGIVIGVWFTYLVLTVSLQGACSDYLCSTDEETEAACPQLHRLLAEDWGLDARQLCFRA